AGALLARPGRGPEDRGAHRPGLPRARRVQRTRQPSVPVLQRRSQALGRAAEGGDCGEGGVEEGVHSISRRGGSAVWCCLRVLFHQARLPSSVLAPVVILGVEGSPVSGVNRWLPPL